MEKGEVEKMSRKKISVTVFVMVLTVFLCACGEGGSEGDRKDGGSEKVEFVSEAGEGGDASNGSSSKGNASHENTSNGGDLNGNASQTEGEKEEGGEEGQLERELKSLRANERIYQNENGFVKVIFEDGEYYEFFDYPNEWTDGYFWNCDWSSRKLEGDERNIEICTGKDSGGVRVYRTIYATHEVYYPMEYYEQGLSVDAAYLYLNISEDTFTQIYVDMYEDYCYNINSYSYGRVDSKQ